MSSVFYSILVGLTLLTLISWIHAKRRDLNRTTSDFMGGLSVGLSIVLGVFIFLGGLLIPWSTTEIPLENAPIVKCDFGFVSGLPDGTFIVTPYSIINASNSPKDLVVIKIEDIVGFGFAIESRYGITMRNK